MVSNEGKITTFGTTGTLGGLVDGTDKLHSGILKTLWNVSNGSRVVSSGTLTQSGGTFTLATPVIYRSNGTKVTLGTTASHGQATVGAGDATYDRFDLLFIDKSGNSGTGQLSIAAGTAAAQSTVADIAPEDVPVAIIKVVAGAAVSATHSFQVLMSTFDKDVLSDDEVTYAKIQNVVDDERILGRVSGANGVIEELTQAQVLTFLGGVEAGATTDQTDAEIRTAVEAASDSNVFTDADHTKLNGVAASAVDAAGAVAAVEAESTLVLQSGVTVGTDLKLSTSSDNVVIENVTQDKDIIFQVDDGGVDTEVMRIDGSTSRVGIGTDSPDARLHLEGTANDDVVLLVTNPGGTSGSVQGSVHIGLTHFSSNTVPSATISVVENTVADHRGNLTFGTRTATSATAVPTEKMRITHSGKVGIGNTSPSVELEVTGDVAGDKFLVESVQYELEILSNAGATPGPPTPAFTLADTDTIFRVSTVAGTPPGTGNIDLALPSTTNNEGLVYKLIVTALDGASPLTIGPNSGNDIVSETLSVLAASGASHTISATGVYELVCFSGSWMFYKIA